VAPANAFAAVARSRSGETSGDDGAAGAAGAGDEASTLFAGGVDAAAPEAAGAAAAAVDSFFEHAVNTIAAIRVAVSDVIRRAVMCLPSE